ncbi:LysR family transcriptional regulator [Amycolatopsis sp. NPDC051903]|uniref:LysR family transcriptional regulator n=1 Tax=Amycolatopsis sp. NPDC051903 TaxID=3363936 RepID=UPI0037B89B03
MELRHLRYFVAVAEEGGFSRAASRLHVVQPTLSMQIRDLERELGGALFDRGARRTSLTAAGRAFLVEARRVLAQADRAQATARLALAGETGTVRIGVAGATVLADLLAGRLRAFHTAKPRVQICLQEAGPQRQRAAILSGELDVGFSALPAPPTDPRLASTPIGSLSFVVALPTGHPLTRHKTLTTHDLRDEDLIEYSLGGNPDDAPAEVLSQAALKPRPTPARYRADTTLTVLALVSAGAAAAIVPAGVHRAAVPDVEYRPLTDPNLTVDFHLLHRSDEPDPAVTAFLNT